MSNIHITVFQSVKNSRPQREELVTLNEFFDDLLYLCTQAFANPAATKSEVPLFGFYKLRENTTRSNQNVEWMSCIVFDFDNDNGQSSYSELNIPFNHFYYTTFNSKPSKPKFRIVIPLDESCSPQEYQTAYWGAFKMLGEPAGCDHSAADLHRAYYIPARPVGGELDFRAERGEFDAVLGEILAEGIDYDIPSSETKEIVKGRNLETTQIIGAMLERGCQESEILDEILRVDNERANPLFKDRSERFGGKSFTEIPRINALNMLISVMGTVGAKSPETIQALSAPNEFEFTPKTLRAFSKDIVPTPTELCLSAPGITGELVRAILKYAPTKPAYALGGALTVMGVAKGRSFCSVPGKNFANLYTILVGRSGSGKDAPLSFCSDFASHMFVEHKSRRLLKSFTGEQASGAAIEDNIADKKSIGIVWDEIGKLFCRLLLNKAKGNVYEDQITSCLLKYYSAVRHPYVPLKSYSKSNKDKSGDRAIEHPFLSVLGSTTTGDLCDAMSGEAAKDGTIPRMLFLTPEDDSLDILELEALTREVDVSETVVDELKGLWKEAKRHASGRKSFKPVEIELDAMALVKMKECARWQRDKAEASRSEAIAAAYARTTENALKFATAIAHKRCPVREVLIVDGVDAAWAIRLAQANVATIISILVRNIGKPVKLTRQQELQQQIENLLRVQPMTRAAIISACEVHQKDKNLVAAIKYHLDAGNIEANSIQAEPGSNVRYTCYYWSGS